MSDPEVKTPDAPKKKRPGPPKGCTSPNPKGKPPIEYNPKIHPAIVANCTLIGMKDAQIARMMQISIPTLNKWRKRDDYLKIYVEREKEKADLPILESLRKRCLGYSVIETTEENETGGRNDGKRKITRHKRHVPADATSMIFWLKNRHPDKWNDRRDIHISIDEIEKKKAEISKIWADADDADAEIIDAPALPAKTS